MNQIIVFKKLKKNQSLNEGLYWHTCKCGENALDSSDGKQVGNLYTLLQIFTHCANLYTLCSYLHIVAINCQYLPFVKGTLLSAIFAS